MAHLHFACSEVRTNGTAKSCYIIHFMRLLGTAFPALEQQRSSIVETDVDVLAPPGSRPRRLGDSWTA